MSGGASAELGYGPGLRKVAAGKWPRGCLLANNFNNEIKHTI
jgi:hypothetical protein